MTHKLLPPTPLDAWLFDDKLVAPLKATMHKNVLVRFCGKENLFLPSRFDSLKEFGTWKYW